MSWPASNDPFYLANTTENTARRTYYGVNSVPHMKCDGATLSYSTPQPGIQARLAVPSPLWMDLIPQVNGSTLNLTVKVVSEQNITSGHVLHMVLLDRYTYLPASPNGQPHHYHAMLKMAPSSSGQNFTATVGDTMVYTGSFALSPSWLITNLDVSAFVQNNSSRDVLQARCEQLPVNIPGLYYASYTLQDNGNNDGRAEPGETASMFITLGNQEPFQTATNVVGTLSTTDPTLTITTPTVSFPNIPNGGTGANTSPMQFVVSSTAAPHPSTLHLHVVADPGATQMDVDIPIYIGWPDVLLVDDDNGGIFEQYYEPVVAALGASYELWNTSTQGTPLPANVTGYGAMIWWTGFVQDTCISVNEQNLINAYLNGGGKLFISGQNLAAGLNVSAPTFLQNTLHATYNVNNTMVKILNGVAGNPVGDGLILNCNPGGTGSGSCTSPDGISVLAPASSAFTYQGLTHSGGLTYSGTNNSKLVLLSVPFEAISGQSGSATRQQVLETIFDFFGFSGPTYPNVQVTLTPVNPPIIIPAAGGQFTYNAQLQNLSGATQTVNAWIMQRLPNGTWQGPLLGPVSLVMPNGANVTRSRFQNVPGTAASGVYLYCGYVGTYSPMAKWDSSYFNYTKTATDGAEILVHDWANWGESFEDLNLVETPADYALLGAFPNPFNPSTTIRFDLPEASDVTLTVFDLTGRAVANLVSGHREAGTHTATFDAAHLASGMYVYCLQAGDFTATGKMMLLK
ncbi:MAG: T9SS C-terminal target domain-containing protein [Candidatus Zixiibacteriota bacterium]|nr:MAG: T9SS C-terminal target domain-containing protein [candidate division Zixibacteria bacterium]